MNLAHLSLYRATRHSHIPAPDNYERRRQYEMARACMRPIHLDRLQHLPHHDIEQRKRNA